MSVRFGINFMPTASPREVAGWAREVERLGYELLGISDSQSICRDVHVTLALCAANTERIRLGSRVITPLTRHPAVAASAAATLEELAPGRTLVGIGSAYAQSSPDITIKTPAIQAIQARMKGRFDSQLRAHFDSGALGFGNDGTVSVRDAAKIPLAERVGVNQAVADQNRDSAAVYREVAVANGHPEWEAQIRKVFARQWIDSARGGWWYEDANGGWKQK